MSGPPRRNVDLHRLPRAAQYAIALVVAGLVGWLAWSVGRNRPAPAWLGPVQAIWTWLGPALLVFFIVKWLLRKIRR
jgi:hypothetical protein